MKAALNQASLARSIFHIQLLHDWLALADRFKVNACDFRINFPGILSDKNWSIVMPFPLEKMLVLEMNPVIQKINRETHRA